MNRHEVAALISFNRGDSFHDYWANIGTLIYLKDWIQSAIAAHTLDWGYNEAEH